jgi:5-hydroxyisourate hydrolase
MKPISVHVVDVANGVVARGMRVEVVSLDDGTSTVLAGTVGNNGLVEDLDHSDRIPPGNYELRLHVGDYYRERGTVLPERLFMDVQVFRFGLFDGRQHYHLPVKLSPWGMSLFRGA